MVTDYTTNLPPPGETWYNMSTVATRFNLNCTAGPPMDIRGKDVTTIWNVTVYAIVCLIGLLGNGLVIYVVMRYSSMKTPTNMYLVNLSIADALFLISLPMLITIMLLHHWIFGTIMCKLYNTLDSINKFAGTYTLLALCGDRYLAVCHPVTAAHYRTTRYISIIIVATWIVAILLVLPVFIFSIVLPSSRVPCGFGCIIMWPGNYHVANAIYAVCQITLGFILPVILICILYSLLVVRLSKAGARLQAAAGEKRRTQNKKVTRLVTLVIVVYIVCWLPFWCMQIFFLILGLKEINLGSQMEVLLQLNMAVSILRYVNSMVNPLLYTFTNEHFRHSFIGALKCAHDHHQSPPEDDGRSHINGPQRSERTALTSHTHL